MGIKVAVRDPRDWRKLLVVLAMVLWLTSGSAMAEESSDLPRHELELRALVEPDAVLALWPDAIAAAQQAGDRGEQTLLWLARANACRVIADWRCQQAAGSQAAALARTLDDPVLLVRGLIADSRGSFALQDYARGEQLLAEAQIALKVSPNAELAADVYLGYSSLSHSLGKHESAERYADLGLAELGADLAQPMRARLLRNRGRAQAQLGQVDAAKASLMEALQAAERVADPKLVAELSLEGARVARLQGDIDLQRQHGQQVLQLSAELANSQLRGLGLEVLGLAALDAGQSVEAETQFQAAITSFRSLGLARDELRLLRQLLQIKLARGDASAGLAQRYLELDQGVAQSDRAKAADDYEARLKYAEQELDVVRLQGDAALAHQRALALEERHRLGRLLTALALSMVLLLAVLIVLQRRSNRRLRDALAAVRESDARTSDLLRLSKGLVYLHDLRGELLMANPATAEALLQRVENLPGRMLQDFVPADARSDLNQYLLRIGQRGQDEGVLLVADSKGQTHHWRYSSRLSESRAYVIGNAVDISDHVREAEALRADSLRDALTGAYNRRYLERFESEQADAPWAVVNIDLDHFKQLNDSQGHEAGDRALVAMTRYLEHHVRAGDAVVRSGGDEFLLLLANADEQALDSLVRRLRDESQSAPCRYSLGYSLRVGSEDLASTMARADALMYALRRHQRLSGPMPIPGRF